MGLSLLELITKEKEEKEKEIPAQSKAVSIRVSAHKGLLWDESRWIWIGLVHMSGIQDNFKLKGKCTTQNRRTERQHGRQT